MYFFRFKFEKTGEIYEIYSKFKNTVIITNVALFVGNRIEWNFIYNRNNRKLNSSIENIFVFAVSTIFSDICWYFYFVYFFYFMGFLRFFFISLIFAIQPFINHQPEDDVWEYKETEKFFLIVAQIALFICVIIGNTVSIHQLFVEHSAGKKNERTSITFLGFLRFLEFSSIESKLNDY